MRRTPGSEAEAAKASRRTLLKPAVVMGGVSLAALGGCAASPSPPAVWSPPAPQPRSASPVVNPWALFHAPLPLPHGSWDNWGRDAAVAAGVVGSVEAGKYVASKLYGAPASDTGAAAEGAEAEPVEAEPVERIAPPEVAPPTAGEVARAATAVETGAERALVVRGAATAVTTGEAAGAARVLLLDEFFEALSFLMLM